KQGEPIGRQPPRIIIPLEEVKPKEYGIGDDYWLEDDSGRRKEDNRLGPQNRAQDSLEGRSSSLGTSKEKEAASKLATRRTVLAIDSSDEDEQASGLSGMPEDSALPEAEPSRSRAAKAAEKANSQRAQS